ncbi:MAG TPA: ABC transporter substrate-binding protein [Pseudolabrys sp.]|jgi:putative ABC transport system substrate-binding protein|nr:ABC transporter substrate-binding protein [Pseudolabrys sp.]
MRRREFIAVLGGAMGVWSVVARAQLAGKPPTIGFLGSSTPSAMSGWTAAFVQRLRELGWIEGRTVAIEYRWGEGRNERYAEIAEEFVRLKVDVIVTYGTPPSKAAKQATAVIPIVFAAAADPVGSGLVSSLARPGGNITGLSLQQSDIVGKKLELLREVVTGLRRLALLGNVGNASSVLEVGEVRAAAGTLGIEIVPVDIKRAEDIAPAFDAFGGSAEALYVSTDPLIFSNINRINTLAVGARLPTIYNGKEYIESGGLMSYGPNYPHLFRRAADFVDKILRGAKPGDFPVEQPTKFDFAINLTTAKAIGLTIPPSLLARADEVIE